MQAVVKSELHTGRDFQTRPDPRVQILDSTRPASPSHQTRPDPTRRSKFLDPTRPDPRVARGSVTPPPHIEFRHYHIKWVP
jgi:hypothetical protein